MNAWAKAPALAGGGMGYLIGACWQNPGVAPLSSVMRPAVSSTPTVFKVIICRHHSILGGFRKSCDTVS